MQDKEIRIFYRGIPTDTRYAKCRAQSAMTCEERYKIDPETLVGRHMMSGVDFIPGGDNAPAELRFVLDGVAFAVIEDPSDGYRSMLDGVFFYKGIVNNAFPAVSVYLSKLDDDTSDLYNMATNEGKVVVQFGTENSDDYYPCFVAYFDPTALGEVENAR